jgi:hypothetical protein
MLDLKNIGLTIKQIVWVVMTLFFIGNMQNSFATPSHHRTHHAVKKHSSKHYAHKGKIKSNKHKHHPVQTLAALGESLNEFIPTTECPDPAVIDGENIEAIPSTHKFASRVDDTHLADFAGKTVANLNYSSYKLGGKRFDPKQGVYILDCSNFVDHLLQEASPRAYSSLVSATGADTPASQQYYNFFKELADDTDSYWNKIEDIEQLRAGDILVFRYKNSRGVQTGGHVMVVMNTPLHDSNVYLVRVADSAPTRHSEDTRQHDESGIGIGTLLLKSNPKTGKPSAYAWGLDGYWNKNVNIAMARPVEIS